MVMQAINCGPEPGTGATFLSDHRLESEAPAKCRSQNSKTYISLQILSGKRTSKPETNPNRKSNCFILTAYLRTEIWKSMKVKKKNTKTSPPTLLISSNTGRSAVPGGLR